MSFTVPGEIPWTDPKFSEVVAQEALDRYKQNTMWVLKKWVQNIPLSCITLNLALITKSSFFITELLSNHDGAQVELPVGESTPQTSSWRTVKSSFCIYLSKYQ